MKSQNRVCFLANVCHVCKSKNTSITCEICKMIFYCSPEHRRENWLEHSELCWSLNKFVQAGNGKQLWELFDGKDFTNFRHEVAMNCTRLLGRSLKPWEYEIIYYPRICDVCKESNWEKLNYCNNCQFVYTCEKRHFRKDHKKWCETLKVYSEINILEYLKIPDFNEIKLCSFENMSEVLSPNFGSKNSVEKALASELLTYPLTILNSLKLIKVLDKKQVTVFFVGAEVQAEVEPLDKWEKFLLHFLQKVSVLNLIFIGPELFQTSRKFCGDLCERCRSKQKLLNLEMISGKLFHECLGELEACPDLICALNSGMYRNQDFGNENSWEKTILKLFVSDSPPVLISEYTSHELKMDLEKIRNLCGEIKKVVKPQANPFASLKPGLNVFSGQVEAPVIFKNYFFSILKKQIS